MSCNCEFKPPFILQRSTYFCNFKFPSLSRKNAEFLKEAETTKKLMEQVSVVLMFVVLIRAVCGALP